MLFCISVNTSCMFSIYNNPIDSSWNRTIFIDGNFVVSQFFEVLKGLKNLPHFVHVFREEKHPWGQFPTSRARWVLCRPPHVCQMPWNSCTQLWIPNSLCELPTALNYRRHQPSAQLLMEHIAAATAHRRRHTRPIDAQSLNCLVLHVSISSWFRKYYDWETLVVFVPRSTLLGALYRGKSALSSCATLSKNSI